MSMEKVTVPCGERGDWQIKPYEITMEEARLLARWIWNAR